MWAKYDIVIIVGTVVLFIGIFVVAASYCNRNRPTPQIDSDPSSGGEYRLNKVASGGVEIFHDDAHGNTCYVYGAHGISCVADSVPKEKK
jgi:hypothetical protein